MTNKIKPLNHFGRKSRASLDTCQKDLVKIHETAIILCPYDYGIHEGGRTVKTQQRYFDTKKTKLNPKAYPSPEDLARVATHIIIEGSKKYGKSRGTDMHLAVKYKGKSLAWDRDHLIALANYIIGVADCLFLMGVISHRLRWGGNWDKDGVILKDQSFDDLPHLELYVPKS